MYYFFKKMFADDTCLFVTNKDRELVQVTLNRDVDLISNWAHQWLVTFSPPKTRVHACVQQEGQGLHS